MILKKFIKNTFEDKRNRRVFWFLVFANSIFFTWMDNKTTLSGVVLEVVTAFVMVFTISYLMDIILGYLEKNV